MKNLLKKVIITLFIMFIGVMSVNAGVTGLESVPGIDNIKNQSISTISSSGDISTDIENNSKKILTMVKYIITGVLLIFMIYIGIQMIISMGSDEEALSSSKRQIWYTMIGLLFINIPGGIYDVFISTERGININVELGADGYKNITDITSDTTDNNLFINSKQFDILLNNNIIGFIELTVFSIAVLMIILSGIKIITSAGKDEDLSEAKKKILWSMIGLIFIGFIESLQYFVYTGNISDGANMFETFELLVLFFAGPIAIFYVTLAGYYYITSAGDEEKVKKAKSIIINVLLATLILLVSHLFLQDLITL